MTIKIKVTQPAIEQEIEITLPAFRKRGNWYYAVVSEKEAIEVFKSNYESIGVYIATGERMVNDAFDIGTEDCSKEEFLEAMDGCMANVLQITRQAKEDNQ